MVRLQRLYGRHFHVDDYERLNHTNRDCKSYLTLCPKSMSMCAPWAGGSRSKAGIQGFRATPETPKLSESISLYPDRVYFHTWIPQKFATTPASATVIIRSLKPPVGSRDEVHSTPETRRTFQQCRS